jgi:hypothetical protein
MKSLFADYKTPTMAQCEMLGREIGLVKRVVQVFFQNARAKNKRGKLPLQQTSSPLLESSQQHCKLCGFSYSNSLTVQDHVFTKQHIDMIKASIKAGTFPGNHKEHYLDATTTFTSTSNKGARGTLNSISSSSINEPDPSDLSSITTTCDEVMNFLHHYTSSGSNTIINTNFPNRPKLSTSIGK